MTVMWPLAFQVISAHPRKRKIWTLLEGINKKKFLVFGG
jgi:hypothetical protein